VRLFEIGTVFRRDRQSESGGEGRESYLEEVRVGLVFTGRRQPEHWSAAGVDADFWDLRGLVEQLADLLPNVELRIGQPETDPPGFGFGRWLGEDRIAMFLGKELVGAAGPVRSGAVDGPPWAGEVFAAEFVLSAVGIGEPRRYEELPTYPSSSRDLALWLPQSVSAAAVERLIGDAGSAQLVLVRPFDVYEADNVAGGRRSIAWRLVFRATDRTLTDAEIEASVASIVRKLREDLDVRVRES
jgi:phenylalanyl-tRNA synthetase beta chain